MAMLILSLEILQEFKVSGPRSQVPCGGRRRNAMLKRGSDVKRGVGVECIQRGRRCVYVSYVCVGLCVCVWRLQWATEKKKDVTSRVVIFISGKVQSTDHLGLAGEDREEKHGEKRMERCTPRSGLNVKSRSEYI